MFLSIALGMRNVQWFMSVYTICCAVSVNAEEIIKESVDEVIEDEITQKLGNDLIQSIEKKFQVDLERSVDMVLVKIKTLLQNGTSHIQDKLVKLQAMLRVIKDHGESQLEECLVEHKIETSALAEKALHQMVVCGYALIGHDPAQALAKVVALKAMISQGVQPIYEQKREVLGLLKVCGHDHESLKKVVKCVISKSPLIKSAMMEISGKLIEGVVDLTKLMAHGAMHEACLIEVIKTTEDEAFDLVKTVSRCAYGNETLPDINAYIEDNNETLPDITAYIKDNNATVLDVDLRKDKIHFNHPDKKLQKDLGSDNNLIDKDTLNDKKDK